MLNLYLDYYGEYAENKYRDMYLYDEQGVYMTFHDCYVFLVSYEGSKCIKMVNSDMNIRSCLKDAVDLIDKKYKVGEDSFYADNMKIKFINSSGYVMPGTGSSGMLILAIIGTLLLLIPILYISVNILKKD